MINLLPGNRKMTAWLMLFFFLLWTKLKQSYDRIKIKYVTMFFFSVFCWITGKCYKINIRLNVHTEEIVQTHCLVVQ